MTISEFAVSKIGCGYVYGATGWICNPARREAQAKQYPEQANNILNVASKWDGKQCYDCAQLTKAAAKAAGFTDSSGKSALPSGATSQWNSNAWQEKGTIETLPKDSEGIFLYRTKAGKTTVMEHTGIYIGNGEVVDARGSKYGVIRSSVDSYPWTNWARLKETGQTKVTDPQQKAENAAEVQQKNTTEGKQITNALVVAPSGSTVNLRDKPNGKVLVKVPLKSSVLAEEDESWTKVTYNGVTGWMMSKYISKGNG